ncbi:MAG: c-type cytochrome [Bauldia sp.]
MLTVGLAAGVWSLAASSPGAETAPLAGLPAVGTVAPHGVLLAQAPPPAADAPAAEASAFAALVAAGDVAAGQTASLQCAGCHTFDEGGATMFGPNLFGIVDRPVASVSGFSYSPAMAAVGAAGGTWTVDFLNEFLTSPQAAIPGTTMPFGGIADEPTRVNLIAYLATLGGEGGPAADAGAAPAGTPVMFTAEQADRGERRYTRDCLECHGETLTGGLIGGPPLKGLAFEEKYLNGASAAALFLFTSTAMPPDNPGRLQASVYADLVAYILEQNGFPAGTEELPDDVEALSTLIMTH